MSLKSFLNKILVHSKAKEVDLQAPGQHGDLIKGIDLKIDPSIQEICSVYIKSSSSTRGVLYVLLLVSLLSLISVINTHKDNWTISRINSEQDTIDKDEGILITLMHKHENIKSKIKTNDPSKLLFKIDSIKHIYFLDSIKNSDKINREVNERNNLIRNSIENSQTVKIPVMGNSFDINNLAIVSGISSIILLIVVRFTLSREKNNLRIAFTSITERYDGGIEDELKIELLKRTKGHKVDEDDLFKGLNRKRRRYHYNLLSMNEIFNIPELDSSNNILQKTATGKIVTNYMYSFVFLVYLGVFINDLSTFDRGLRVSHWQTITLSIVSYICLNFIARICDNCNDEKKHITNLFNNFRADDYKYDQLKDLGHESGSRIRIDKDLGTARNIFVLVFFVLFYAIYFILKRLVDVLSAILYMGSGNLLSD